MGDGPAPADDLRLRLNLLAATVAIPAGTEVALQLTGNPVRKGDGTLVQDAWTATGAGTIEARNGKTYLVVKADGRTTVTGIWR